MTLRAVIDVYCGYCDGVHEMLPIEGIINGDEKSFTWMSFCPACDLHIEGTDSLEKLNFK